LVELLIVMIVVPIIIGAMSVSLMSVFSLQSSVASRLGGSADSQVVTTNFAADVQGAVQITTSSTQTQCGTGTQVMGIILGHISGSSQQISYVEVLASGSSYNLVRNLCSDVGNLSTPISSRILAYDIDQPCSATVTSNCQSPPVAYNNSTVVSTTSWVYTQSLSPTIHGITTVTFDLVAPKSSYLYTASAEPLGADSTIANQLGSTATGNSCGFALPGTGYYATQLCFFDFTSYFASGAIPNNTPITEYVPGGYKFTADLTVTGDTNVVAANFPTYQYAFLGNAIGGSAFYSGVGCPTSDPTTYVVGGVTYGTPSCISPAIYQNGGGTTTVTLSNIKLTTVTGALATGYELVTADAETTDVGESHTWTSNLGFNQVPDTSTSPEGDACSSADSNGNPVGGGDMTPNPISNSTSVFCGSTYQAGSTRTGTLMLDVAPPSSGTGMNGSTQIQDVMVGTGLQGVSFGLLLP
jgi:hypothetical protein